MIFYESNLTIQTQLEELSAPFNAPSLGLEFVEKHHLKSKVCGTTWATLHNRIENTKRKKTFF